jgi:hypothetical protein
MKVKMPRKRVTVVVATAMALALGGGIAYAYFTAAGSGTGQATVGTSGTWTVAQTGPAVGLMTPGGATSAVTFTITNTGDADHSYTTLTASVNADVGGAVTEGGTPVTGCLASWFGAVAQAPVPAVGSTIAPFGTASDVVVVTMPANTTVNQDACKGATPDITLSIDTA